MGFISPRTYARTSLYRRFQWSATRLTWSRQVILFCCLEVIVVILIFVVLKYF